MTILHYNPDTDSMITKYVVMLVNSMSGYAENVCANSLAQFQKLVREKRPDIVHIHGCWHWSIAIAEQLGRKSGARIVLSPHGQLEPWVLHSRYITYRLPRLMVYLRRLVHNAYSVIATGRMEQRCINRFTTNPRVEVVLNALITSKINEGDMCRQIYYIYNKVLSSSTWELMSEDTHRVTALLIKAGIAGDERWIDNDGRGLIKSFSDAEAWRQIMLYAHYENIRLAVLDGARVTGAVIPPMPDAGTIPCYLPKGFRQVTIAVKPAADVIEQFLHVFKALQKTASHNMLSVSCLVLLYEQMLKSDVDEGKLFEALAYNGLDKFAARLMAIMSDRLLLDEGHMILPPLSDRKTGTLRKMIDNRLKI